MPSLRRPRRGLLLALAALCRLGAQTRFESDEAGFPVRELGAGEAPTGAYLLERSRESGVETERLYEEGRLVELRTRRPFDASSEGAAGTPFADPPPEAARVEERFREELLVALAFEDGEGLVLEERRFLAEGFVSRSYRYLAGRLVELRERDASGLELGVRNYRYDARGRLLEARSSGSLGSGLAGTVPAAGGGVLASWTGLGDETFVQGMGSSKGGLLVERFSAGELVSTRKEERGPEGRLLAIVDEDLRSGRRERIEYDEEGRPARSRIESGARLVESRDYAYDEAGRLLRETLARGKTVEERLLSWADAPPEGTAVAEPASEEEYRDGLLLRRLTRPAPGTRIEELFDRGVLFVRTTYRDGRKRLEEFFSGGKQVRKKEYP